MALDRGARHVAVVGPGRAPVLAPSLAGQRFGLRGFRDLLREVDIHVVRIPGGCRRREVLAARRHHPPFIGCSAHRCAMSRFMTGPDRPLSGRRLGPTGPACAMPGSDGPVSGSSPGGIRSHANARRVLLQAEGPAHPASGVLALGLRRPCDDMQAVQGFPVRLGESLVDPLRSRETSCQASNGRPPGFTRGIAREREAGPAGVIMVNPRRCSRTHWRRMSGLTCTPTRFPHPGTLPGAQSLRSLPDLHRTMEDFRTLRGQRYGLAFSFTVLIAMRLPRDGGVRPHCPAPRPGPRRRGRGVWEPVLPVPCGAGPLHLPPRRVLHAPRTPSTTPRAHGPGRATAVRPRSPATARMSGAPAPSP